MEIERIAVRETNCYLLRGPQGCILIDPGPPGGGARVIAAATQAGVEPQEVRLILITHGHLDHYGAAAVVKAWCGAPVTAHPGEDEFSRNRRNALPPAGTLRGSIVRWLFLLLSPLMPIRPLEMDMALEPDTDLSSYGLDGQIVPIPGHSPGSIGLITAEGDAFVGDLFVNYAVPSQPLYLSDRAAWRSSAEQIRRLDPRRVYVGHGEPFPGAQLAKIRPARYQLRWWVR